MAETSQNPSKKKGYSAQSRREFIQNCRNSKIELEANFPESVMRIYRLRFQEVTRSAYLTRFYCNIDRTQGFDVEQKVTKEMKAIIDNVNENIQKKLTVANQLIKKSNIKIGLAQYEKVNEIIIDPIAKVFLKALNNARDLEEMLRVLWLDCQLDDTQKRQALSEVEKEFSDAQQRCLALMIGVRNRFNEQRLLRESGASGAVNEESQKELSLQESEVIDAIEAETDSSLDQKPVTKKTTKKNHTDATEDQEEMNDISESLVETIA